jgi:branched-chain amino acid transport system permease protein
MQLFWQVIANSIITSAFYAIITMGLCLVFGVMRTANYAHGEFFMIGAYVIWLLYTLNGWPFFVTVLAAIIIVGLLGVITERVLFRPVRGNIISGFIISLGLVFILQVLVGQIWGVGREKPVRPVFLGSLAIGNVYLGWQRLVILPAALLLLGGLYFFLTRTKLGRGVRACAQDREAASLHGVNANTMAALALGIGCAMAGGAGALMAPIFPVTPYMGSFVIWTCFVVIIVGGTGNLKGTIYASLLFGFLYNIVTTLLDSTIANIMASLMMLIFLAFRPQGLVGYVKR